MAPAKLLRLAETYLPYRRISPWCLWHFPRAVRQVAVRLDEEIEATAEMVCLLRTKPEDFSASCRIYSLGD
jgi:hypothetical protein